MLTMAFALYVSLIPFRFETKPVAAALREFSTLMTSPKFDRLSGSNFLANLLLFIPVGFGLGGARLADRQRTVVAIAVSAAFALAASVAVSLTAEFLQMFAPGRVTARADVEAQTVGCLAGMSAWLAIGQPLTWWLRAAQSHNRSDRVSRLLVAYIAAWAFANLAPFDFTADLGDLSQRYHSGMINVLPFSGVHRPLVRVAWDVLIAAVSAIPIGVASLVCWRPLGGRRSVPLALAIGIFIVSAMEVLQIFVASHAADGTDALFGAAGVAIGVAAGVQALPGRIDLVTPRAHSLRRRRTMGLLAGWCAILLIYHWIPFDFAVNPQLIRAKLGSMSLAPLAGYARGSDLNALDDLLVKIGLAMPVGFLGAFLIRRDEHQTVATIVFAIAVTLTFALVEAGQLFLPSRVPDPSDVAVGVASAMAGLWVGRWLRGPRGSR
jgi:VanZ family protein